MTSGIKNAVIYCLDVETYMDGNGDGIGDFIGLTQRMDYLTGLGITCLWLMPFYPTPNKDNGYDVMDYYSVDPRLGNLGDFVEFTRRAEERGIRIIVDLVVNHTSDQHPWFQEAVKNQESKYWDYYLWSEKRPENIDEGIIFPGKQETTWTYHDEAGAYYAHRFYDHQADLNITNPAVREEIQKNYGLLAGPGGLGLSHRCRAPSGGTAAGRQHFLSGWMTPTFTSGPCAIFSPGGGGDAILLAETNETVDELPKYFGQGDRMQMLFNFWGNQHLYLALARQEAAPLAEAFQELPPAPPHRAVGQFCAQPR